MEHPTGENPQNGQIKIKEPLLLFQLGLTPPAPACQFLSLCCADSGSSHPSPLPALCQLAIFSTVQHPLPQPFSAACSSLCYFGKNAFQCVSPPQERAPLFTTILSFPVHQNLTHCT